jgi:hypothetical protein
MANSKTPEKIGDYFHSITGVLKCHRCSQVIVDWFEFDAKYSNYDPLFVWEQISYHICPAIPFKYDFNSPLSINEQYNKFLQQNGYVNPIDPKKIL